eukprot:1321240-Amorphochlora_amoeboformis.AAC.1
MIYWYHINTCPTYSSSFAPDNITAKGANLNYIWSCTRLFSDGHSREREREREKEREENRDA